MSIDQKTPTSKAPQPAMPAGKSNTGAKPKSKAKPKKMAKKKAVSPQPKPGESNAAGGNNLKVVSALVSNRNQSEFFGGYDERWGEFQDTIAGLGYHLAACHSGYDTGGDKFLPRLKVTHTLVERQPTPSDQQEDAEPKLEIRNNLVAEVIKARFPDECGQPGTEVMLHEYATLLEQTREELHGELSPSAYPILLGLYAIRNGGWWISPHMDRAKEWKHVFPGYGQLFDYIWRVGPQTGASGGYGWTPDEGRWEVEAVMSPSTKRNPLLIEFALMDACRIALAKAAKVTALDIDLQDVVISEMHELLGCRYCKEGWF